MTITTTDGIADAALAILRADGSAAVTMRRVATAVDLTPMAIYRHYQSREALLQSIADRTFSELGSRWAATAWSGDPDADLQSAVDQYLDFALAEPHLHALLFVESRTQARRWPDDFREHGSPTLSPLADAFASGMDRGLLRRDDPWELALAVSATMQGLVSLFLGGRIALAEAEFRLLVGRSVRRVVDGVRA